MSAAYDNYDYTSYWKGRDYEHQAEVYALKKLLEKVPKVNSLIEIGAGFGRLVKEYEHKAQRVFITDPSAKLLKMAREIYREPKYVFIQSSVENISKKIKKGTLDLAIIVRVLHHLKDAEESLESVSTLLKPGGYLILEYPNKLHFKARIKEYMKGNFTFAHDILHSDIRSIRNKENCLPFYNYHPFVIDEYLKKANFTILEKRSVSNIRSRRIKRLLSPAVLFKITHRFQKLLGYIDFGPSIFVLARKEK